MKKNFLKVFAMAAVVAVMAACSGASLESKISSFEKAVEAENWEQAASIAKDIEANYQESDLTDEQKGRLIEAAWKAGRNMDPYLDDDK